MPDRYKVVPVETTVENQLTSHTVFRTRYFVVDTNDPGYLDGISGSNVSDELLARIAGYVYAECATSALAQVVADELNP